jgi:hypothetical protein
MYLVLIAWLYVALMMAVAEATHSNGTLLGAMVTFVLYGLLPAGILMYVLSTPARRRAKHLREMQETAQAQARAAALFPDEVRAEGLDGSQAFPSSAPNAGDHAPAATELPTVTAVRKPD